LRKTERNATKSSWWRGKSPAPNQFVGNESDKSEAGKPDRLRTVLREHGFAVDLSANGTDAAISGKRGVGPQLKYGKITTAVWIGSSELWPSRDSQREWVPLF
jgi:hypothetical protein